MSYRVHRLYLPLSFPSGVSPGEGGDYNLLMIARNGGQAPVLRGTALAGALKHAWRRWRLRGVQQLSEAEQTQLRDAVEAQQNQFFGYALDETTDGAESALRVGDTVLDTGGQAAETRTHHWRNRHTGTVVDGGLFSMETCPKGTRAHVTLWLHQQGFDSSAAEDFLKILVAILNSGMALGGRSARGVGQVSLDAQRTRYQVYDLADAQQHAAYLDDHRAWRNDSMCLPNGGPLSIDGIDDESSRLELTVSLGIPRGQDLLIGDGQGLDHEIEPQRTVGADGKTYWRFPGASLRGLFRSWITRLAARAGHAVADNAQWYQQHQAARRMETISEQEMQNCPVLQLFGSTLSGGRIDFADAFAPCSAPLNAPEEQLRVHVAVDRVTGGAAESMLFENTVLTAYEDGTSPCFDFKIRVEQPCDEEVEWLAQTIQALDLGLLRVGSSKSGGRLCLLKRPSANEPWKQRFEKIVPSCAPPAGAHGQP